MFYEENLYFKNIPTRDTVTPISRVLKRKNWRRVSQYLAWVLYTEYLMNGIKIFLLNGNWKRFVCFNYIPLALTNEEGVC